MAASQIDMVRRPGTKEQATKHRGTDDKAMSDNETARTDYTQLDDSALIAVRRQVREQLEREPADMADVMRAHYLLTTEVVRRTIALRRQGS
jgi:hypothetical protein